MYTLSTYLKKIYICICISRTKSYTCSTVQIGFSSICAIKTIIRVGPLHMLQNYGTQIITFVKIKNQKLSGEENMKTTDWMKEERQIQKL